MFSLTDISFLKVLGAGVVYMIIGMLWYGPFFGKKWMKLKDLKEADLQGSSPAMGLSFVIALIGLLLVAVLHQALEITEARDGIHLGVIIGLIFSAFKFNDVIYDKPGKDGTRLKLWLINMSYITLALAIAGYIYTL